MAITSFPAVRLTYDGYGNPIGSLDGAINIHDADVHNRVVNTYIHQHTATTTTLTADVAANSYILPVADLTGFNYGDALHINTTTVEPTHPIVVTGGTALPTTGAGTLYIDRRTDFAHLSGDIVTRSILDLSTTAGTLATPQEFWAGPEAGDIWHITSISLAMGHSSAGDLGTLGNIAGGVTNGIDVRARVNGNYGTLTNWKTNGDIDIDTGGVRFPVRSGGGGTYGTSATGPLKDATGAVLRLDGNTSDRFEVFVQDDLTSLVFFTMKIRGHYS